MSLEEFEKNKLIAETNHLNALTNELGKKANSGKTDWVGDIKKWTSLILSIISVAAAIWGLLIPINSYIQERKKMLKYDLNNHMVELMPALDSTDPAVSDRSILLLSYYERNSLPILFYKLERSSYFHNQNLVNNITQVIANIYVTNKKETNELLKDNLAVQLDKLAKSKQIDNYIQFAIYNLFFVIEHLPLSKRDIKAYQLLLDNTKQELLNIESEETDQSMLLDKLEECVMNLENK